MAFECKTSTDKCDVCGLPCGRENRSCPQHEVWRLQKSIDRIMTKHVFVYGTLKRSEHNNIVMQGCEFVGVGIAEGCALIDLGGCPGMVPARCQSRDYAKGEIYRAENIDHILVRLDRLENEGRMYKRVRMPIRLLKMDGGPEIDCWTYLFMPAYSDDQFVAGGDWQIHPEMRTRCYGP